MSIDKGTFINDYVDSAMESPHESRNPDQIFSDAEADWEATQIDLAYERYCGDGPCEKQRTMMYAGVAIPLPGRRIHPSIDPDVRDADRIADNQRDSEAAA